MATAQLPQVRTKERRIPRGRVIWLAFAGVIVVGLALDLALLAATGLLAPLLTSVEHLPKGVLYGSGVLLLVVAIPGGRWETRRLWQAHLLRVRERRIEQLAPLASRLHISPLRLNTVTVKMLHDLSPKDFELAMRDLLALMNYRNVQHTGRTGDLCVDLKAIAPNGKQIVVQCKRYATGSNVTSPEVQQFLGMVLVQNKAPMGLYLTTSDYTRDARKLAADHPDHLKLYDGDDLVRMVRELAIH